MLKEEIEELRKKLEKESIAPEIKQEPGTNNNHNHDLPETLRGKEKDLEILTRELDDKVRFRQKPVERPGSGAGRTGSYSERTHSRSGSIDESRSFESTERPRSRGAVDAWVRPVDDQRRNFQGSKERGFFSNRLVHYNLKSHFLQGCFAFRIVFFQLTRIVNQCYTNLWF